MKKNRKQKFALVLSGGGFNCAFQLGALNYINKNWKKITGLSTPMKFDIIAGVSGGALNGSLVAMNELTLLNDLWIHQIGKKGVSEVYTSELIDTSSKADKIKLKIDVKQLAKKLIPELKVKFGFFNKLGLIFSKQKRKEVLQSIIKEVEQSVKVNLPKYKSIADNTPLRKKLEKYLDRGKIKGTDFLCGFVSLDTGAYHGVLHNQFRSEQDFINGVIASTSIPMVWNPVKSIQFNSDNGIVHSLNNVDGGVRNVTPLGDVIKLINQDKEDCDYKIIVINTNSGKPKQKDFTNKSIIEIAVRSLYEIAITEVFNNDVHHFNRVNKIVKQAEAWDDEIALFNEHNTQINSFDAVIINPHKDIEMGSSLVANEKLINFRMLHGASMAQIAFDKKVFNNG
jgi:NTE family protein